MQQKIEGRRRMGRQSMRWLDDITNSMNMTGQTPGDGEGQGSLECCSPWGRKEPDMTEQLNKNKHRKKVGSQRDICICMFIAVLFTIAKR